MEGWRALVSSRMEVGEHAVGGRVTWVEGKASQEEWGLGWSHMKKDVNKKWGIVCGSESSF